MRVHVYSQEINLAIESVQLVETVAVTGKHYYGVRFYLHSSDRLHDVEDDDDRSAVTFWLPGGTDKKTDVAKLFRKASGLAMVATDDAEAKRYIGI